MIFPALLAKILAGGALAQAATGATVVVVAVTGAGAAGVLPGPVQDRFAAVVEVATPFEAPTSEEPTDEPPVTEEPVEEPVDQTPVGEPVVDEEPVEEPVEEPAELTAEEWAAGPTEEHATFGAWVSSASGNEAIKAELRAQGTSFGQVVSSWARAKGKTTEDLVAEGVDLGELAEDGEVAIDEPEAGSTDEEVVETQQAPVDRSGRGNRGTGRDGGSAGGQGSGHGGAGHGGGGNGGGNGGGRN